MTFLQKRKVNKLFKDTMKYSGFGCVINDTIYVIVPKLSKYWIRGKKTVSQKKSTKYKKELYELSFEQQIYYKELCSEFMQRNSKDFDLIFTDPYDLDWSLGI